MRPKLKIGLFLDNTTVPYWTSRTIDMIIGSYYAQIVLLILQEGATATYGPIDARGSFLYKMHVWTDNVVNKPVGNPLAPQPLPGGLEGVERVRFERSAGRCEGMERIIEILKGRDLDVLVDFSTAAPVPVPTFSDCARYGLIAFSPGDGIRYGSDCPGFWEIFDHTTMTCAHVKRCSGGAQSILYMSYSNTFELSERINRDQAYFKGISFLPRVLRTFYEQGDKAFLSDKEHLPAWNPPSRGGPGNWDMMRYFARRIPYNVNLFTRQVIIEDRWGVRYKLGEGPPSSFDGFTTMVPPLHTWWGDPQVVRQDDDYYIFIEELRLPRGRNRGHISVIHVDGQGRHEAPVKILERPYHMSYPFIIPWKGTYYMVPETSEARTIELWEAVAFPYEWKHVMNLMTDVSAVDSTLVQRDGRWWLYCNMKENEGSSANDELFLFYSPDLLSDQWKPHPLNPVISDARSARPGGVLYEQGGILYRPAQDCSQCYGYAIVINKVSALDERNYKEERVAYIDPKLFDDALRVHTFSHIPGMTVVDTYMTRSRLFSGR